MSASWPPKPCPLSVTLLTTSRASHGRALTDEERRWFRQVIQRIAALPDLDALYEEAVADAFTATDLGIAR